MSTKIYQKNKLLVMLIFIFPMMVMLISAQQLIANGSECNPNCKSYLPISNRPPANSLTLVPIANDLEPSTTVAITNAGDTRLFVGKKVGRIYVMQRDPNNANNFLAPTIFLDITDRIAADTFEEGLLSIVFPANYASTGFFYISYTSNEFGRITLSRFSVSSNPNLADPNSELKLLTIDKPDNAEGQLPEYSPVHNAGDLHFGPDGYLYLSTGDGGPDPFVLPITPGDPNNNSQRLNTLLGKMIRLDVNNPFGIAPDCGLEGYSIPPDNPFSGNTNSTCGEIWSYGWRNPWRFSFDSLTGDMFVGDVGEWLYEELDYVPAGTPGGLNYGWRCYEGTFDHSQDPDVENDCDNIGPVVFPLWQYNRTDLGVSFVSITGGIVYRGSQYPWLYGRYLFADFGIDGIWALSTNDLSATPIKMITNGNPLEITTFGLDMYQEMFVGGYLHGPIYRITTP